MVSGNKSKAVRNARAAVVTQKSTPWGLIAAVTAVVVFAGVVFGYAIFRDRANDQRIEALAPFSPSVENQDPSRQIEGVVLENYQAGQHVRANEQVAYTKTPPFGGAHDDAWATCNGVVYEQPIRNENVVHSLEHGAVWIAYNPDLISGGDLAALEEKVDGQPFMLMSPYPGLDTPISLQSWGHQLKLSDADDPRIDQFIFALRRNTFTVPEANGSCNEVAPELFSQDNPPPFAPAPAPGTPGAVSEVGERAPAA
jgi:hypothetical protein